MFLGTALDDKTNKLEIYKNVWKIKAILLVFQIIIVNSLS